MDFQIADSRTWQPFKIKRAAKKDQAAHQTSLLRSFFQRLGFKPKTDETSTNHMKEITMLIPCIAGGKPRKKGECVIIPDLQAAELISMKVASLKRDVPNTRLQPWEKPRAQPAEKKEVPALK